jgi:hypothetical protein
MSPSAEPGSGGTGPSPHPRRGNHTAGDSRLPPSPPARGAVPALLVVAPLHREGRTAYRDKNGPRQGSSHFPINRHYRKHPARPREREWPLYFQRTEERQFSGKSAWQRQGIRDNGLRKREGLKGLAQPSPLARWSWPGACTYASCPSFYAPSAPARWPDSCAYRLCARHRCALKNLCIAPRGARWGKRPPV